VIVNSWNWLTIKILKNVVFADCQNDLKLMTLVDNVSDFYTWAKQKFKHFSLKEAHLHIEKFVKH
jgi:hypothetical protein